MKKISAEERLVNQKIVALIDPCKTGAPAAIAAGRRRRRSFNHQCYRTALEYLIEYGNIPEIFLIHGELRFAGIVPHAWIEFSEDVIFDGTLQRYYQKACYYSRLLARKLKSYPLEVALRKWTNSGHYGPWADEG